jgi:mannose-6-phosphate isomerase-like protein (cupin superfamily)
MATQVCINNTDVQEDGMAEARIVEPGAGAALWFGPNRMTVKATAADTGGGFGLLESRIPAGASPALHVHHGEDESFYVLDGEITFVCGERELHATAGSFVFLPRGVPHTFVVEGDREARVLTLMTPGGGEGFFVDAGRPAGGPGLPPAGPPDVALQARVAPTYAAEILGPPIAPRR